MIESIKNFGEIFHKQNQIEINNNEIIYKFKKCLEKVKQSKKYTITGPNDNIITKTGTNNWMGAICENQLNNQIEYKWKIKILNSSQHKNIMIGISPIDIIVNSSSYYKCGWYLNCNNSTLCSGPPHNYLNQKTNLKKVKNEIIVILNIPKKSLKFIIDNEDKGESYFDIPIDKPLSPAVLLSSQNDSVEIVAC